MTHGKAIEAWNELYQVEYFAGFGPEYRGSLLRKDDPDGGDDAQLERARAAEFLREWADAIERTERC